MRIELDRELCMGSGACEIQCPALFSLDERGLVVLAAEEVPAHLEDDATAAAEACPNSVITVVP